MGWSCRVEERAGGQPAKLEETRGSGWREGWRVAGGFQSWQVPLWARLYATSETDAPWPAAVAVSFTATPLP